MKMEIRRFRNNDFLVQKGVLAGVPTTTYSLVVGTVTCSTDLINEDLEVALTDLVFSKVGRIIGDILKNK